MKTSTKGTPKRDGSGQGQKANQGRGGCKPANQRVGVPFVLVFIINYFLFIL